jgi:hypothetical protein
MRNNKNRKGKTRSQRRNGANLVSGQPWKILSSTVGSVYSSAKIDKICNSLSADLKTLLPVQLQINAKIYIKKKKTK